VITTSAHARDDLWSVDYPAPAVILLGSEAHGLAREDIARGSVAVRIPMDGAASSLNLGVAAGILLYEIARRRVAAKRGEP
jgi:tRNA G18 (ribose-2'-O)-methylase SpoU